MQLFPPIGPEHAPQRGLFNEAERKRFLMLSALLVIAVLTERPDREAAASDVLVAEATRRALAALL